MATEKQEHPLDHTMTSLEVATVASKYDAEEVEGYITNLRPEIVPVAIIRAQDVKKMLDTLIKMGESRITAEKIVPIGGQYVDPDTAVLYDFKGDMAERKMADPRGCKAALAKALVPGDLLNRAIFEQTKCDFRVLAEIAKTKREWAEIIEDFEAERAFRPPHFKEA